MNVFTLYRVGGETQYSFYCIAVAQENQCCWSCYSTEMIIGFIENIHLNPISVLVPYVILYYLILCYTNVMLYYVMMCYVMLRHERYVLC